MPFLILLLLALTAGVSPRSARVALSPARRVARAGDRRRREGGEAARATRRCAPLLGRQARPRVGDRARADARACSSRSSPASCSALLAYLVRTNSRLDRDRQRRRASGATVTPRRCSTHALNAMTQLGSIYVVVGLCVVLVASSSCTGRASRWIVPFVVAVVGGEEIVVDRDQGASSTGRARPSTRPRRPSARRSRAATRRPRRRSTRPPRCCSAGGARGRASGADGRRRRDRRGRRGEPRPARRPLAHRRDRQGSRSAGPGSRSARIAFGGRVLHFGAAAEVAAARLAEAAGETERTPNGAPTRAGAASHRSSAARAP